MVLIKEILPLVIMLLHTVCSDDRYTNTNEFYRTRLNLTEVPDDIPDESIAVNLDHNKITTLKPNAFSNLPVCRSLILDSNSISRIDTGAFNGLQNLTKLWVRSNVLEELTSGTFQGLETLEELNLWNNHISVVDSGTFTGLKSLLSLKLKKNKLTGLTYSMFRGLENLVQIWLESNSIASIEDGTFRDMRNLQLLRLSHNNITKLTKGTFKGLTSLKSLKLYDNKITTMESDVFDEIPRPLRVGLAIPRKPPNKPVFLQCDSDLCWLKKEEEAGTVKWFEGQGHVYKPDCAGGTDWDTLDCEDNLKLILIIVFCVIGVVLVAAVVIVICFKRKGSQICRRKSMDHREEKSHRESVPLDCKGV